MNYAGRHVYADALLRAYPGDDAVLNACERAIRHSKMTVVACTTKRFEPHGTTAVWILAESHFTLHTYPEYGYISVDCYTCGDEGDPDAAINHLLGALDASSCSIGALRRGRLPVGGHQCATAPQHISLDRPAQPDSPARVGDGGMGIKNVGAVNA
ncbi:MAG: S-adenosylmethionine decarboxylase proenzyme [Pseudomonadota bacterium]|jgi:S-adenosylmethionine decarboxylase